MAYIKSEVAYSVRWNFEHEDGSVDFKQHLVNLPCDFDEPAQRVKMYTCILTFLADIRYGSKDIPGSPTTARYLAEKIFGMGPIEADNFVSYGL
jgi:hypothetical protein